MTPFLATAGVLAAAIGALLLFALDRTAAGTSLLVLGVVLVLASIFRRYRRPGDFSKSGWSGQ